eukprot:gene45390-55534_t
MDILPYSDISFYFDQIALQVLVGDDTQEKLNELYLAIMFRIRKMCLTAFVTVPTRTPVNDRKALVHAIVMGLFGMDLGHHSLLDNKSHTFVRALEVVHLRLSAKKDQLLPPSHTPSHTRAHTNRGIDVRPILDVLRGELIAIPRFYAGCAFAERWNDPLVPAVVLVIVLGYVTCQWKYDTVFKYGKDLDDFVRKA